MCVRYCASLPISPCSLSPYPLFPVSLLPPSPHRAVCSPSPSSSRYIALDCQVRLTGHWISKPVWKEITWGGGGGCLIISLRCMRSKSWFSQLAYFQLLCEMGTIWGWWNINGVGAFSRELEKFKAAVSRNPWLFVSHPNAFWHMTSNSPRYLNSKFTQLC
jgi:hypothetical protein